MGRSLAQALPQHTDESSVHRTAAHGGLGTHVPASPHSDPGKHVEVPHVSGGPVRTPGVPGVAHRPLITSQTSGDEQPIASGFAHSSMQPVAVQSWPAVHVHPASGSGVVPASIETQRRSTQRPNGHSRSAVHPLGGGGPSAHEETRRARASKGTTYHSTLCGAFR